MIKQFIKLACAKINFPRVVFNCYRRKLAEGERKISYLKASYRVIVAFFMRNCYRYRGQPAVYTNKSD